MPATRVPGVSRTAQFITARRTAWLVALVPILLAGAILGMVGEGQRDSSPTDTLPVGFDSTQSVALQERLPADDGSVAIVLWIAGKGELTQDQVGDLTGQAQALAGGAQGGPPPIIISEDGTAAYSIVPVVAASSGENADRVEELRTHLTDDVPDGVKVQVTGPAGIQADIAKVFEGANFRLLLSTAGVVAILLIATYRSPVLWLIPLIVVGIADRLSAIIATRVMERVDYVSWDESTVGILSVLVFGAGTDYALLLISRYRDELKHNPSRHDAMARALTRTAHAVLSSSVTVFLGLLTLMLSAYPTTRGLGLACAIGIMVVASFVMVVLPAALVLFGRWIFWPRVPHVGEPSIVDGHSFWRRVGDRVAAKPVVFVVGTMAGLIVLMAGLFQIETGLRPVDQFLDTPEAIVAGERLGESFPAGTNDPVQVLTRDDSAAVLAAVEKVNGISSARVTTEADGIAQIDAVLEAKPGSNEARDTVVEVRDAVASFSATHVGGGDAQSLDDSEASVNDRWVILPVILLVVLGALLVLLRSVVAPLLLVATVVATYAAAMGASWWIFTGVFGFAAMDVGVPLLAFLFLVALGVDYNIFLVTRAREEAVTHGSREGMLRGLTATGGVITSAGILLAAVFAVLGVLPLVVLAQLGAVIFVGVLLDTLIVRTVLVPALALALGDRFWWPRKVDGRAGHRVDDRVDQPVQPV
ncbi:MAG: MMPL family transporter [Aeromicrobium sp.]